MSVHDITEYLSAANSTLNIFKSLRDLVPSGDKRKAVEEQIGKAEQSLTLTNAKAAKALDFKMCQCSFPPQIMLSKGYHPKHSRKEVFVCPSCNKQDPSPAYFEEMDRVAAHNAALPPAGWME